MSWIGLAAITLDARGGGVAAVSRLMARVLRERWSSSCRVLTLVDDNSGGPLPTASASARLRFGASLAKAQALKQCRWIMYSHLAVAQVQMYVPTTLRRPYGVFLHGIEVWRPLTRARRRVLQGASLLVANSTYTANRIRSAHPWIGPIAVCPLALLPDVQPRMQRRSASAVDAPPTALVVARMDAAERYKGHDQLLEAWPSVLEHLPAAQLIFVGEGDDAARLQAKAHTLGIGRSVVLTGFVPDATLSSMYENASVLAMPSRNEGFGLAYLEAMAHRVPCIGSVHDAAADVIEDGVTGFLVQQDNIEELSRRLLMLLSDRARGHAMGQEGKRRLDQEFSYSRFRDRLLGLLTEAFGAGDPAPDSMGVTAEIGA